MRRLPVIRKRLLTSMLFALALGVTGCKIEHRPEAGTKIAPSVAGSFENTSFDPKAEVQAIWESQVLPTIDKMAADYPALKAAMKKNLEQAGAQHGYREKGEGGTWSMAVRASGQVIAAETELSAGTADIDVDGDGQADLQIQIGPVIRGTTIRDALPFISFTNYTNQIDFAQLANAFNDRAFETTLKTLDRNTLLGKRVALTGVFPAEDGEDLPLVTVTAFKVVAP